jgi:Ca2+-binding EF-hand superfamily protein
MNFEEDLVLKIVALMRQRFGGDDRAALDRLFAAYDHNGDGEIDGEELMHLLADAGIGNDRTRKAWVRAAMSQLDQDGNGTINLRELASILE